MEHRLIIKSLHDAMAECSCGGWSTSFTGAMTRTEMRNEFDRHAGDVIEKELRERWTAKGVPKEKQDAIIKEVEEKAKPGAIVGPFQIPE